MRAVALSPSADPVDQYDRNPLFSVDVSVLNATALVCARDVSCHGHFSLRTRARSASKLNVRSNICYTLRACDERIMPRGLSRDVHVAVKCTLSGIGNAYVYRDLFHTTNRFP